MKFTFESQGTNTFLVYQLSLQDQIDSMTLGMINNNRIDGMIPFSYSMLDQQRFFKYNVSSRISLAQYFSGIVNRKRLIGVMSSITSAILNAQDYMIEPASFVWNKEYIFVDVSSAAAQLICLPVFENGNGIDLEAFFKDMLLSIQFDQTENCDHVARMIGFFNSNTHFSLLDFQKTLRELEFGEGAADQERQKQDMMESYTIPMISPEKGLQESRTAAETVTAAPPADTPYNPYTAGEVQTFPVNQQNRNSISGQIAVESGRHPSQTPEKVTKKLFGLFSVKEKETGQLKAPKNKRKEKRSQAPGHKEHQEIVLPGNISFSEEAVAASSNACISAVTAPSPNGDNAQKSEGSPVQKIQQGSFGGTVVLNDRNKKGGTVLLNAQNAPEQAKRMPFIVRVKNGEKMPINKDIIKLGSDASYVDFLISDNRAVSRSHADIRVRGGCMYLLDNNSLNHTFVEGRMLAPNMELQLTDGMHFRLADEEFEFHLL